MEEQTSNINRRLVCGDQARFRLIELVKEKPRIWNFMHPDYNKAGKEDDWDYIHRQLIAEGFTDLGMNEVRIAWKSLRQIYARENRLRGRKRVTWRFEEHLRFLDTKDKEEKPALEFEENSLDTSADVPMTSSGLFMSSSGISMTSPDKPMTSLAHLLNHSMPPSDENSTSTNSFLQAFVTNNVNLRQSECDKGSLDAGNAYNQPSDRLNNFSDDAEIVQVDVKPTIKPECQVAPFEESALLNESGGQSSQDSRSPENSIARGRKRKQTDVENENNRLSQENAELKAQVKVLNETLSDCMKVKTQDSDTKYRRMYFELRDQISNLHRSCLNNE